MEARSIPTPLVRPRVAERATVVPIAVAAVVFAATSIVVGVVWDISWHMTNARDTFWTPAHLPIYIGGVLGGAANGVVVLRTTFRGSEEERGRAVRFWGFRGPLGSWVSIWGAFAMLTSAPFDDWWHNAYGLDVQILSPPHVVLALGMIGIALGTMLSVVAMQNRRLLGERSAYPVLFAYASGVVLAFVGILAYEYSERILMHSSLFYQVAGLAFPVVLVATARASRLRWAATATALVYMAITAALGWLLPLFPAEPMLGPIYHRITRMVPMDFPLLLVAPAIALDLVRQRWRERGDWRLAAMSGVAFLLAFLAVQWPFANFLQSPASMNWFFHTDNYYYALPPTSYAVRRAFVPIDGSTGALVTGLVIAAVLAAASARVGLWWGGWMRRVRR